jgi:DNA-binding NarL/FixJ family response regulator
MRIVLADSDPRTSSALKILLQCESGIEVVGEVTTTARLMEVAESRELDLLLLDWELSGRPDAALLSDLRRIRPGARIVALSGRPESERDALRAGADAFISKAEPASALMVEIASLDKGDQAGELAQGSGS